MLLKDICVIERKTINPQKFKNDYFYHFSLPNFDENKKSKIEKGNTIRSTKYVVDQQMILFNKLNVRFKRVWNIKKCPNDYISICSGEFIPLIINNKKVLQDYIYYYLLTDKINNKLIEGAHGTSSSHQRISIDILMNIDFFIPSINAQQHIVDIIENGGI